MFQHVILHFDKNSTQSPITLQSKMLPFYPIETLHSICQKLNSQDNDIPTAAAGRCH